MTEQARDTEALIRDQIAKHAVLLYMKGTPQFPQLGINGELVGGSDIMLEMFQNGELKPLVEQYSAAPEA